MALAAINRVFTPISLHTHHRDFSSFDLMQLQYFLEQLERAFHAHDFSKALTLLSSWITFSFPGEPEDLLWQLPATIRPKAAVMVGDILSHYPNTLLGYPILAHAIRTSDNRTPASPGFALHYPNHQPNEWLTFLGWLSPDTKLPLLIPSPLLKPSVSLSWANTQSLVAVFQCQPAIGDATSDSLSHEWWADLFYRPEATVVISAGQLLPLPSALETARLMHLVCTDSLHDKNTLFLTQAQRCQAHADGSRFLKDRQSIFGQAPHQNGRFIRHPRT